MWRKCLPKEIKSWGLVSSVSSNVTREHGDCLEKEMTRSTAPTTLSPVSLLSSYMVLHSHVTTEQGIPSPDACSPEGIKAPRLVFKLVTGDQDVKRGFLPTLAWGLAA